MRLIRGQLGGSLAAPTLVWLQQDLRLDDQPALAEACRSGEPLIPVYLWSPSEEGDWALGGAARWWLHQSLRALDGRLRERGSRLVLRRGPAIEALTRLCAETGARRVLWNRRYEPAAIERDRRVKQQLSSAGIEAQSFNGSLLWEPWEVASGAGSPYRVFTPFWKGCLRTPPAEPQGDPPRLAAPEHWPASDELASFGLEPQVDWASGLRESWTPGELGAARRLERLRDDALDTYAEGRDRPDLEGVSRLSPHLHFGEISPRRVWHSLSGAAGAEAYLRQIGWREFAHHLLYHFPETAEEPLRPEFSAFPWREDAEGLRRWQRGRSGYPIVDAGMRQLWATGWMHNRVRMIVASFLVKDLLIPWQQGARWFWDTLVDADLANNTLGWQWTAGCGADAAPYFRVFNPVAQGRKFDPNGDYVRRWVPELAALAGRQIHAPWEAADEVWGYPEPIVEHAAARKRALAAWEKIRRV